MSDTTTNDGLFFTIKNDCDSAANGFAVGDKLYLLKIDSATFMRPVFQGDLAAGEDVQVMTGANSDGNGVVLFVPPVSSSGQAVEMTVSPNETVKVPSDFCGSSGAADRSQLRAD
ncbi:MAG: hypothetical protein AAGN46_10845 [Acidobacteriota bacterium]